MQRQQAPYPQPAGLQSAPVRPAVQYTSTPMRAAQPPQQVALATLLFSSI